MADRLYPLDPIIALLAAFNILFTGYRLLVRSGRGLMDISISAEELDSVKSILNAYKSQGVSYHALRSRRSAARNFMVVHLLIPGDWTITAGHNLADEIETQVRNAVLNANIVTHIEPPRTLLSIQDASLDRTTAGQ
jgi:divalent metal cation (Fe/Co/Zn/Cd) transporter